MALFRLTIGPLIDYDAKRQADLMRTMSGYQVRPLAVDRNVTRVAC